MASRVRPPSRSSQATTTTSVPPSAARVQAAQRSLNLLLEMATLLNTGLDKQQLATCIGLLEDGTNPVALAAVVKNLQAEASKLKP